MLLGVLPAPTAVLPNMRHHGHPVHGVMSHTAGTVLYPQLLQHVCFSTWLILVRFGVRGFGPLYSTVPLNTVALLPLSTTVTLYSCPQGCIRREGASEAASKAVRQAVGGVAKAVGGGYYRLQMPLSPALAVRGTVAGHRLRALEGGGGGGLYPPPPFQCIPGCPSTPLYTYSVFPLHNCHL